MKKMLFETILAGHRMEYIHHIYMGMLQQKEDEFVIVVPKEFEAKKDLYEWPVASNIRFVLMTEIVDNGESEAGMMMQSFHRTRILKKYVKQEKTESVFLISLMNYIVALPFLISPKVRVSGIVYSIYLYIWDSSSWIRRLQDVFKYVIMRLTPCLKNIFVLNDEVSTKRLNKLYHTNKFKFIPDPYNAIDYKPCNIRLELGLKDDDKAFLHFGGLDRRKGTLDILKAIHFLSEEQKKKFVFVFAGKVYNGIREEFYHLKESLPNDARVIVYDEFCSNEFLANLCISCDVILAPYHDVNRSSGILGHAAYFGKPVIGPAEGLIGNLIKEYRLGVTIRKNTPEEIAEVLSSNLPYKINSEYKNKTIIKNFIDTIFNI